MRFVSCLIRRFRDGIGGSSSLAAEAPNQTGNACDTSAVCPLSELLGRSSDSRSPQEVSRTRARSAH